MCFLSIGFSSIKKNFFTVTSQTQTQIKIDFEISKFDYTSVDGRDELYFNDGDFNYYDTPQKFSTFINLGNNNTQYEVHYEIQNHEDLNFSLTDYVDFVGNRNNYELNEHIFRGTKILEISVNPLSINHNSNQVRLTKNASIVLNITNNSSVDTNVKYSKTFLDILDEITDVSLEVSRDIDYQKPSILYITDPDVFDSPYLQSLVNWRKLQGYEVVITSTNETGNSTTSIKNYITNAYYNWDNPPEYICLVGDANGSISVPTYDVFGDSPDNAHGESDYPYTLIEGNDLYPEMLIGRISVRSNSELATVVSKIIGYEKAYAGTDWIKNTALVGDPYDSGISTIITSQYIEQLMESHGVENINTQYSGSNFDSFMREQINSGISFLNYRGFYGFSNFNQSDVNQLNNGYKLPFVATLTCGVNNYLSEQESVVEALLRAGSVANPSGAVAVVGTSQSYTHTAFNNIVAMGMFEGIYNKNSGQTAGAALLYGKLALINTYPSNPNDNVYLFASWNNLMGDPSTHLWTKTPINLIVNHDSNISIDSDFFEVTVLGDDGRPVSGVHVTLLSSDDFSNNSVTNESGKAYFNIDYQNIGTVNVTSRCHNCVPSETSFELQNNLPNLQVQDIFINDSSGNSDNISNPGENVTLSFDVYNSSQTPMTGCSVLVSSNLSNVQMTNSLSVIGDLPSNQYVNISDIGFTINNNILNHDSNIFQLFASIECDQLTFNSLLPIQIDYGNINLNLTMVSDQNENLVIEPGETAFYRLSVANEGYIELNNLVLNIEELLNLEVTPSSTTIAQLNLDEINEEIILTITASSNLVNGSIKNIQGDFISSNGFSNAFNIPLQVGLVQESDPLGPDEYGYYIYGEEDDNYQWVPEYSWLEINPDFGGDGNLINISDPGDNGDDSQIVNLPFTFTFYGIDYNQITVCSNGWISFGRTEMTSFRNYKLPGTGGPSPMLAAFWDDLMTTNGAEIHSHYDSQNNQFIIQWSNMRTFTDNDLQTFQVIFYNTDSFTPTGDDEIKIQYKVFNNTSEGSYPVGNQGGPVIHGQHSTIGIENHLGNIGLEYTYNDNYPLAASPLTNESALFFTTRIPQIYAQPALVVSDNIINIELDSNEQEDITLTLSNNGQENSILNYNIGVSPFSGLSSDVDSFGYSWINSIDSDELDYDWVDVSPDASILNFSANDVASDFISLGFPFSFYGTTYNQFFVNPNGWIGFEDDNNGWNNQSVFSEDSPNAAIFAFWDDLNPESSLDNNVGSGNIYVDSSPQRCIVWFDNVSHWTSLERLYDFQLILYPNNTIKINYRQMQGNIESGTIGIINQNGDVGHQVVYNDIFMQDNLSLCFKATPAWLSFSYLGDGTGNAISFNESDSYLLSFNADNLLAGEYSASVVINPDASFNQIIPLNMSVLGPEIIYGDINFDGSVNVLDVVAIMGFIIESISPPTSLEFQAADVNQDFSIDVLDVVMVVSSILGS